MGTLFYVSSRVLLSADLKKKFNDDIKITDDFSLAAAEKAGVIISPGDSDNPTLAGIRVGGYPVIMADFSSLSENSADAEAEKGIGKQGGNTTTGDTGAIHEFNVYLTLTGSIDGNLFSQLAGRYAENLSQLERENYYREGFERQEKLNREFLRVGIALSAERDNGKLLNYIMAKTREVTKADAGSLYLLDPDRKAGTVSMIFKIAHNDSNPTDFTEFRMPVQKKSIAGYVALTGEVIKLEDAYAIPGGEEYSFNRSYDESTGYRTKSMLTVPMKNHKDRIIGVIQLINKKKKRDIVLSGADIVEESVVPFTKADEEIVLALSSLAAVSLDNNQLYNEIENLFECLVRASAKAIEQRDPATSGHSARVARYTVALAEAVSQDNELFPDVVYSADHLKGLRYACLLHDFGKVGVRENVLVKAKKLYPGMLEQIISRFEIIAANITINSLKQQLELDRSSPDYSARVGKIRESEKSGLDKIARYINAVTVSNETSVLDSAPEKTLEEIKSDKSASFLTDDELEYLAVKRGSLTLKEREEIMSHASHTYDFLKNIPWPENMDWIPEIAKWHHEALDGSGYPDRMTGDKLPLESRLMAVADIFDALTASDRPYKRSVPAEKALSIIEEEAVRGKLDRDVVRLFIKSGIHKSAGQNPGQ